jgi:hypothetical protein
LCSLQCNSRESIIFEKIFCANAEGRQNHGRTESWGHGRSTDFGKILSCHDSVGFGCGFAALRSLRLMCALAGKSFLQPKELGGGGDGVCYGPELAEGRDGGVGAIKPVGGIQGRRSIVSVKPA